MPDNDEWVEDLFRQVADITEEGDEITYYGSRDSFLWVLPDSVSKVELKQYQYFNASEFRKKVPNIDSFDFRSGYIRAINDEFPGCYSVVDTVVLDGKGNVLLGRKPGRSSYCIPGGFADDGDPTLEFSAIRELNEETTLKIAERELEYVMSKPCDIFGYQKHRQPFTSVFVAKYHQFHGTPSNTDELVEVGFYPYHEALKMVGKNHKLFIEKSIIKSKKWDR